MERLLFSELTALFLSAFISSTLMPGGSELLLIYYLNNNLESVYRYFIAVTIGNSLGAIVTYFMGYYFYWGRKKVALNHRKVLYYCQKYGAYALLFSWLPIVGDLLPLIAGWLRLPIIKSTLFIFIGKACRYSLVIGSTLYYIGHSIH